MNPRELLRILGVIGIWSFIADLVAFGAGVSAAFNGSSGFTVCVAVLALAIAAFRRKEAFLSVHQNTAPLGSYLVVRFLVLAGAMVIGTDSTESMAFWLSAGVLAISLSFEPVVRNLSSNSAPYIFNLPGIENRRDTRFGYGLIYVVNTVAIMFAYFAADGRGGLTAVFALLVVMAACLSMAAAVDSFSGNRARKFADDELYRMLDELKPTFAFYYNAPLDGSLHMGMWLPYLERVGEPFFVVVRNRRNLNDALAMTDRPVLLRRSREDLDDVIVPSLRAVFYGNLAAVNEHMVWYSHLTHVQLNHGESDKKSSFNPVYKMYDRAFVAGQAGIDRFAANGIEMPKKAFSIVGRPQVENVEVTSRSIRDIEKKTVLYAPTWSGFHQDNGHCSLPVAHEILSSLLERGCTVIFRPHPFSYRSPAHAAAIRRVQSLLAENAKHSGLQHVYGKVAEKDMTINDCFNASDAMVSDVSSVIGDYLFSEKPFAIVAIAAPESDFHELFPVSRAGYIVDAHDGRLHGLPEALDKLLTTDSLENRRKELRTYYLGDIPSKNYAQRFVDEACNVIHQNQPPSVAEPARRN